MDRELSGPDASSAIYEALRDRLRSTVPTLPLTERPGVQSWLRQGDGWQCVETGELSASCEGCGGPLAPLCGFCPPVEGPNG